jgi:hypothetical protein
MFYPMIILMVLFDARQVSFSIGTLGSGQLLDCSDELSGHSDEFSEPSSQLLG